MNAAPMKSDDSHSLDPAHTHAHAHAHAHARTLNSGPSGKAHGATSKGLANGVCDQCRTRRVKCDYKSPCCNCLKTCLTCTRSYKPRKRGPKGGNGRVQQRLKEAQEAKEGGSIVRDSSAEYSRDCEMQTDHGPHTPPTSVPSSPPQSSSSSRSRSHSYSHSEPRTHSDPRNGHERLGQYRPTTKSYLDLIPKCIELYYEHIYPIMPLLYMPAVWQMIQRPLQPAEQTLLYALSAKTCFHMRGKSLHAEGPDSWEMAGRFFLDECEASRKTYDYVNDVSLFAVISSFWMSTSSFEIKDDWKSGWYMKEALNFAIGLRLHDESSYEGLSPEESLCRRRTFWLLFITERSLAIFRKEDILLRKTPKLPTTRHHYESSKIHSGFLQLISSYKPLDESFVRAWNDDPDASVGVDTYLGLQTTLSLPPPFITRPRPDFPAQNPGSAPSDGSLDEDQYEPTIIQKADLLITQQWLRLAVWRSSAERFLLSRDSPHESMRLTFPLAIARRTASILASLPSTAVEVHGMGIFEKIFEIGRFWVKVLDVHAGAGFDLGGGVLGVGRMGATVDPLEFFVKVLSASPNSRAQFAEPLLQLARENSGVMTMALSPALRAVPPLLPAGYETYPPPSYAGGSVIGEVAEVDADINDESLISGVEMGGGTFDLPDLGSQAAPATALDLSGFVTGIPSPPITGVDLTGLHSAGQALFSPAPPAIILSDWDEAGYGQDAGNGGFVLAPKLPAVPRWL